MIEKTEKILVPIDFNEQSLFALERSYTFARFLGLEIVLLYVYEETRLGNYFASKDEISMKIQEELESTAAEVGKKTGLNVLTRFIKGKVYSAILKTSIEVKARFILMGTNNASENIRMDRNHIGSNTSKVIRQSQIPVITINGKQEFGFCHNILLPLDLTKETRQKVTQSIDIARAFGSGINVVSVLWSKQDKETKNELLQQLNQVQNFIEKSKIRCTSELLETTGGERMLVPRILKYIEDKGNIDLVMIMTQQENRLIEYFLGSAAQSLIRMSKVAVMTVTPEDIGHEQPIF